MKKLLALLLALVLPLCATAETFCLTLTTEANEALFPVCVEEALLSYLPKQEAQAFAALLQSLLSKGQLTMTWQEDALSLAMQFNGITLMDFTIYVTGSTMCMTTSLLPGYALTETVEASSVADPSQQWNNEAIAAITDSLDEQLQRWSDVLKPTVSTGAFTGDSFDGGTRCTTWCVTDADLANLLSSLLETEFRSLSADIMQWFGLDADTLLTDVERHNAKVSADNLYQYIFRMVEDAAGELIGISLTIYEGQEQVSTLSLGICDESFCFVMGLGLEEENYWWQLTGEKAERDGTTRFSGASREWLAYKMDAFSYVSTSMAPLTDNTWDVCLTRIGNRALWDAGVYAPALVPGATTARMITSGESSDDCFAFNIDLNSPEGTVATFDLKLVYAEPIAPFDSSLIFCSMSAPEDAALNEELSKRMSATMAARLVKIIPLDLFLTIIQLTNP